MIEPPTSGAGGPQGQNGTGGGDWGALACSSAGPSTASPRSSSARACHCSPKWSWCSWSIGLW